MMATRTAVERRDAAYRVEVPSLYGGWLLAHRAWVLGDDHGDGAMETAALVSTAFGCSRVVSRDSEHVFATYVVGRLTS